MICQKCKKEFFKDYRNFPKGEPKFCSRSCSNSRIISNETKKKISTSVQKARKQNPEKYQRGIEALKKANEIRKKIALQNLFEFSFNDLGFELKRKRIILEQNNKCNKCDLDSWQGEKLVLEIDHIDGDGENDTRENLEGICPNCHSLTKTWRGRNKTYRKHSDNEIIESFILTGNIRQCLLNLGMAAKGSNYKRVKKILQRTRLDSLAESTSLLS